METGHRNGNWTLAMDTARAHSREACMDTVKRKLDTVMETS